MEKYALQNAVRHGGKAEVGAGRQQGRWGTYPR